MMARRDVQNLPCHVTRSEGNTRTFHLSPPPSLKIEEEFVSVRLIHSEVQLLACSAALAV